MTAQPDFMVERRNEDRLSVSCQITPKGGVGEAALNLGDTSVAVRLEGLTTRLGPYTCEATENGVGPCLDTDGNVVFPPMDIDFPLNELVRITALDPRAEFGNCARVGDGVDGGLPFVEVLMDRNRSCAVTIPPPPPGFPALEFYLPGTVGTIRVTEPVSGYAEIVEAEGALVRFENVPFAPLSVEFLPAGHPSETLTSFQGAPVPVRDPSTGLTDIDPDYGRPGINLREVPCTGARMIPVAGRDDVFSFDVPGLVSEDPGNASSATARVTCAALFRCSAEASFDPADIALVVEDDTGSGSRISFDCTGGTCQPIDPDPSDDSDGVRGGFVLLPDPVTLSLDGGDSVDGRALDVRSPASPSAPGRPLQASAHATLFGVGNDGDGDAQTVDVAIPMGEATSLGTEVTDYSPGVVLTARMRVCDGATRRDLTLSALAERR